MRWLRGKLRPLTSFLSASLLMVSLVCRGGSAFSQTQQPPPLFPQQPGQNGRVPIGQGQETNEDPNLRHAREEAAKKRNIDRQSRMVADANRIVQLAEELNAEVDKSNQDKLSLTATKKAEEIEKLAKSVKDRMKSE